MDLKFGKGFKVEQDGDDLILNLDPGNTDEVSVKDYDLNNLVAGKGLQIVNHGDGSLTIETVRKAPITKEMVEQAIEKKQLRAKATDNHVETTQEIIIKGAGTREKNRDSYRPTEKQLELINEMALEPQTKDSGYVFELLSSTTDLDRSYDRMSNKAINTMVKQTPGRPFFLDHSWNTKSIVGRMLKGKNENGKLIQWAYVPEIAKTKDFLEELFSANINRLSIGFSADYDQMQCSSCKNSIYDYENCKHWPGQEDENGNITEVNILDVKEYMETSAVGLPCLREAGMRKEFSDSENPFQPTITVDLEADLQAKTFNNSIFEKGGLIKEIVPMDGSGNPRAGSAAGTNGGSSGSGRIILIESGNLTLGSSSSFKATLERTAELLGVPEEKIPPSTILSDNTIQDSDPAMEKEKEVETEQEVVTAEEVVTPEAPAAVTEEVAVTEEPTVEAEKTAAPEAETVQVKVEMPSELTEALVKIAETLESFKASMEALDKKVDLAISTPTKGLRDLMKGEEVTESKPEPHWLLQKFSNLSGLEDQE